MRERENRKRTEPKAKQEYTENAMSQSPLLHLLTAPPRQFSKGVRFNLLHVNWPAPYFCNPASRTAESSLSGVWGKVPAVKRFYYAF